MSGGSYNYFYLKLEEFIQEVRENLEEQESLHKEYGDVPLQYRREVLEILEELSPLCKRIEWVDSGDCGPESENKLTEETLVKIVKIQNKLNFLKTCGDE